MRPGEGITGTAASERAPVMIAAQAHLDPRFKAFPNLREDEYESILAVPILARDEAARARSTSARSSRASSRAAEIDLLLAIAAQVAQSIEHAKLYAQAQRAGGRARGAGADLRGGLRVALPRGVARGDRRRRRWTRSARPAPRSSSRTARSRGRRAAPARMRCGCRCAGSGRQIGELVCDRDTPVHDGRPRAARVDRAATPRSRSSTGAR